jgi:hypothetical protein
LGGENWCAYYPWSCPSQRRGSGQQPLAEPGANPYHAFQTLKPDEEIDYSALVYRGDVHMEAAGGISRAFPAWDKLEAKQPQKALPLAEEGVKLAPDQLLPEWALGDATAATGKKDEARATYKAAIIATNKLDPERRADDVKDIEASLKKL